MQVVRPSVELDHTARQTKPPGRAGLVGVKGAAAQLTQPGLAVQRREVAPVQPDLAAGGTRELLGQECFRTRRALPVDLLSGKLCQTCSQTANAPSRKPSG